MFRLVRLSVNGKIAFLKMIRRLGLNDPFAGLPLCIVGMKTCLSAHSVSWTLQALGHEPRIIPAIYVKPLVMPSQSLRRRCDPTCVWSRRRARTSSTCKPATRPVSIGLPPDSDNQQIRAVLIEQGVAVRAGTARPPQVTVRDTGELEKTRFHSERPSRSTVFMIRRIQ